MSNKFDELTKGLAQTVTRRGALKKFGVGLAGMALACFGLANKAEASDCATKCSTRCSKSFPVGSPLYRACYAACIGPCRPF